MADFYRIGAAGLNWANIGSWSNTSGGASNGIAEPTLSDNAIFNASSPNSVAIAAPATCSTLTISITLTFTGTDGFTCSTLYMEATSAITISFKESVTYTMTVVLICYSSRVGSIVLFTSSHATTKSNLVLQNGAECKCLANFTRIDSSGGRPIRTFNGVVTDCINVVSFYDLKTVT